MDVRATVIVRSLRVRGTTLALAFLTTIAPTVARADALVMFQQPGCPYCHAWDGDIGAGYANTDEAKRLPLRRIELEDPRPPDLASIAGVRYTPTFVVLHCGREIDRIVGYSGRDAFWMQMASAVRDVESAPKCDRAKR